ncbi:hypothetical protein TrCOL_g10812 [Triparma columacea]|nr:hypothetical protein TrCOL_g10812 [Triparma columacea]
MPAIKPVNAPLKGGKTVKKTDPSSASKKGPAPPPPPTKAELAKAKALAAAEKRKASQSKQSKFQSQYAEICQKKLSPPVQPDAHIMSSLSSPNPVLEVISENFKKTDVVALVRLLSIPDLVRSCRGLIFKSNEKKPVKSVSADKPKRGPPLKNASKGEKGKNGKKGGKDGSKSDGADSAPEVIVNRPNVDLVKTLAKFLRRAANLKTLSVVGLNFALSDVRLLAKGLCMNKKAQLSQVTFLRCRTLGAPGFASLSPFLCSCTAMSIRVVDCGLTDDAGPYVSSIIRSHGARRDEAIWSAGLRGRAVKAHSEECPKELPTIGALVLDFSLNSLGDASAEAISEALKNDCWLLGLNLGGNKITSKGAQDILKGIGTNMTVRALVLASNRGIEKSVEEKIAEVITAVAATPPPPAAGEELVMKAVRNWAKWSKTSEDTTTGAAARTPASPKNARKTTQSSSPTNKGGEKVVKTSPKASSKPLKTKPKPAKAAPPTAASGPAKKPSSKPSPAGKKAAVKGYLEIARPMVLSNKSVVSDFKESIGKLWDRKPGRVRRALNEVLTIKSPASGVPQLFKIVVMVLGGRLGKGMGADWSDVREFLRTGDYKETLTKGFKVGQVVWGMSSEAVRSKVGDFTKEGREVVLASMKKKAEIAFILAGAVFEVEALWDGLVGDKKQLEVAALEVRKAYKGDSSGISPSVWNTVVGEDAGGASRTGGGGKIEVAVKIPTAQTTLKKSPEAGTAKGVAAKGGASKGEAGKSGITKSQPSKVKVKKARRSLSPLSSGSPAAPKSGGSKEADKAMLHKLENMVDKITDEIKNLEEKIEVKGSGSPGKKASPSKRGASPSKKGSPTKGRNFKSEVKEMAGEGGGDPELMEDISKAVAQRLKELWALDD